MRWQTARRSYPPVYEPRGAATAFGVRRVNDSSGSGGARTGLETYNPDSATRGRQRLKRVSIAPGPKRMSQGNATNDDLREVPAYTIGEAAGYLRLPKSTLRSWVMGQAYRVGKAEKFFQPVIEIADPKRRSLSFINLVEAFVLSGIRRQHTVPLPKVRNAVDFLRKHYASKRPLAEVQFETDGVNLFVRKFGELIGASQDGQILMETMLRQRLKLVKRDPDGIPQKLILFPAQRSKPASAAVVIDPRFSFGRPVLDGLGVRTSVLAERFLAGEMVGDLAHDYGAAPEAIENAIRCELRAA